MKSKRGQAALEFLTTYGWAFLVILIMIGAIVYFGILSPSKVLPKKCILEAGFECKDYRITNSSFDLIVANKKGEGLRNVSIIEISSDATPINLANCNPKQETVVIDTQFNIGCTNLDLAASQDDKVEIKFTIGYLTARGTYSQEFEGTIYATVQ